MRRDPTRAYLASFVALGLGSNLLGPSLTSLREHVDVSVSTIGRLFVALSLGALLGALLAGRGYDRRYGHSLYGAGLGATAACVLGIAWSGTFVMLLLLSFCLGAVMSIIDVGGNTLLVWQRRGDVGPYVNALHLCFGIGALISPVLVNRSIAWGGDVRIACLVLAGVAVAVAVWIRLLPPPTPDMVAGDALAARGAADAHDAATASLPSTLPMASASVLAATPAGTGELAFGAPVVVATRPSAAPEPATLPVADNRVLAIVALFFVLYVGLEIGFAGWIHTYAEEIRLGSANVVSAVTTLFWAAFTVGRLAAVAITRRVRPETLLAVVSVVTVAAAAVLVVANGRPFGVWAGTALFGLAVAPQFPTMVAVAEEHLSLTGAATSWFICAAGIGGLVFPWLIGQLFDSVGPKAMPATVLAASLATMVWFVVVRRTFARVAKAAAATTA